MRQRLLISGILAIALLSLFSVTNVQSQAATMFTSYETSTSPVTSTSVGYVTVGTVYSTSQVLLFSGPFTLNSPPSGCWVEHFPLTAVGGQVLAINISSDRAISFYFMTENSYTEWSAKNKCAVAVDTLVAREGILSFQNNVAIPYNSTFEFLFLNFNKAESATVEFDVGYAGQSASTTIASTILAFTSQTFTSQTILTYSTTSTQSASASSLSSFASFVPYLVGIFVIAIIGIVALLYFRGGIRKAKKAEKLTSGKNFCIECGNELTPKSKFCNNCGTKQS